MLASRAGALCQKDTKCNAWTYHPSGGPDGCALGAKATAVKLADNGNVAGYRDGHSPGSPSPPVRPH